MADYFMFILSIAGGKVNEMRSQVLEFIKNGKSIALVSAKKSDSV